MYIICLHCGRPGFDPWVGKIPWRREWQPTPEFLPAEFHGQRSLAGYSPWGHTESDTTMWLTLTKVLLNIQTTFLILRAWHAQTRDGKESLVVLPLRPCVSSSQGLQTVKNLAVTMNHCSLSFFLSSFPQIINTQLRRLLGNHRLFPFLFLYEWDAAITEKNQEATTHAFVSVTREINSLSAVPALPGTAVQLSQYCYISWGKLNRLLNIQWDIKCSGTQISFTFSFTGLLAKSLLGKRVLIQVRWN